MELTHLKVLVAEDDLHLRQGLCEILVREGYQVVEAEDGQQALDLFTQTQPDLLCLDIMMPAVSGYDVCRQIRIDHPKIPIIFISAKGEEIDKVVGLELGADDYISKPFGVHEVIARIRAVTRRSLNLAEQQPQHHFQMGDLLIKSHQLRAFRGDQSIDLSLREVKILACLYRHSSQVVSRDQLFDECWGRQYLPSSRSLDQQISGLRRKIEVDPTTPQIIRTVHGAGYRYEP